MSSLASFTDFMLATRQNSIGDVNTINNQATRYQCYLLRELMAGLAPKEYLQDGQEIIDFIQFSAGGSYRRYLPGDNFTYAPSNTLTSIKVGWRFSSVDMTWTDHEVELNGGNNVTNFKRVKNAKRSAMFTDFYEGMEDDLWATPDVAEMETSTTAGRRPYSLRCIVTDDGLAPSSTNGGVTGSNWTTFQTVNPSTVTNWQNRVATYDNTSDTTRRQTLIGSFDRMFLQLGWESPVDSQEYIKDISLRKLKILASLNGITTLQQVLRDENDRLTPEGNLQMANGTVRYGNIPVKYVTALDTVDAAVESGTGSGFKPRYRWYNFGHIKPIFHSRRFMHLVNLGKSQGQPFQNVELRDSWRNVICTNRRAQGIVRGAS